MDIPNAFIGGKEKPTVAELTAALGRAAPIWQQLITRLSTDFGVSDQEWLSYAPKYGWSVKLKLKKRTILYLGPCTGCFRASFILGDRAVKAARANKLPASVIESLNKAPRYAEGTGLVLTVKSQRQIPALLKLARVKLAN